MSGLTRPGFTGDQILWEDGHGRMSADEGFDQARKLATELDNLK
jgi:hypothetical protein